MHKMKAVKALVRHSSTASSSRLNYVVNPRLVTPYNEDVHTTRGKGDRVAAADSLVSWDRATPVKLRMEDKAPGNYRPVLTQTMFRSSVELSPNRAALAVKRDNTWVKWDYTRYHEDVCAAAKGFMALGLERKNSVGIMSSNSPEWFISSVAAIFAGGLTCGMYLTNSPETVSTLSTHAAFNIFMVENAQVLDYVLKGRSLREALPTVKKVVLMEGDRGLVREDVLTWLELLALGRTQSDALLVRSEQEQAVNEACMLIYTSGTTGKPKGVMLSHDNVTWSCKISMELAEWTRGDEELLSFLPLSHVAGLLIDCYMGFCYNATTYFADKNALRGSLVDNLREVRPTRIVAVPRVYEKIEERMRAAAAQNTNPVKKALVSWAKSVATRRHDAIVRGDIPISHKSLSYKLAYNLVFKRIHEALGLDRAAVDPIGKVAIGAAPVSLETLNYFKSIDIAIMELYGSTEMSGPITFTRPGIRCRYGAVGPNNGGIHNAILDADDRGHGEIVSKARNVFMGYLGDRKATLDTFTEDSWLRIGDIGYFDPDGFLILSGRQKELLITAGGKNVAPTPVEEAIKRELSDVVSNVLVVGDRRPYLTCLLTLRVLVDESTSAPTQTLDPAVVEWARRALPQSDVSAVKTTQDFVSGALAEPLRQAVHAAILRANEKAESAVHKVKKFAVLPHEFSLATGELTPTLKLKRFAVQEKYAHVIEDMYKNGEST